MLAVRLDDLLTIRSGQRHRHIYPSLPDHHMQVLTGDHSDLVGVRLTTGELSLNRLAEFQRNNLLSALGRATFTSGRLRRPRYWPQACSNWRPDPKKVDHQRSQA